MNHAARLQEIILGQAGGGGPARGSRAQNEFAGNGNQIIPCGTRGGVSPRLGAEDMRLNSCDLQPRPNFSLSWLCVLGKPTALSELGGSPL